MIDSLNKEIDLMIKVNSFLSPLAPKRGMLILGDRGVEFLADTGSGFIQVPWESITLVRAQVFFGGRYIRGFDIYTNENQILPFVVSDGKQALRIMRDYIGSDKLRKAKSNFSSLFKKKK